MIKNKNTVKSNLYKKFSTDILSGIVTEAYVRALPFDKTELAIQLNPIHSFVRSTLENMDALSKMDAAYESISDPYKKAFLYNLRDVIYSVAEEASSRITKGMNTKDYDVSQPASFTRSELNRLTAKNDNLSIEELSKVINSKVKSVLNDEAHAYEKEQLLAKELKETMATTTEKIKSKLDDSESSGEEPKDTPMDETSTPDDATTSTEKTTEDTSTSNDTAMDTEESEDSLTDDSLDSFLNIALDKSDPRHHVSVFSKLQDLAMETIHNGRVKIDSDLPIAVLESMTYNSLFSINRPEKSLNEELDILVNSIDSMATESAECWGVPYPKIAMACSIAIYTLMEVLKTMNIYSPTRYDIKRFVSSPTRCNDIPDASTWANRCNADLMNMRRVIKTMPNVKLGAAYDNYSSMKQKIQNSLVPVYPDLNSTIIPRIDTILDMLRDQISANTKDISTDSTLDKRIHSENVTEFDRLYNLFNGSDNIREINFEFDSTCESTDIRVNLCQRDGNNGESMVHLKPERRFTDIRDLIESCAMESSLATSNKMITMTDLSTIGPNRFTVLKEFN